MSILSAPCPPHYPQHKTNKHYCNHFVSNVMNWLTLSVLSGLCAALNGLFAKLVTNAMSRGLADRVAARLPGEWGECVAEWAVRAVYI